MTINRENKNLRKVVKKLREIGVDGRSTEEGKRQRRSIIQRYNRRECIVKHLSPAYIPAIPLLTIQGLSLIDVSMTRINFPLQVYAYAVLASTISYVSALTYLLKRTMDYSEELNLRSHEGKENNLEQSIEVLRR